MSNTPLSRCTWAHEPPIMLHYHDTEWGMPVHDDRHHFEMLILEGAQAGLSWLTILKRREGYRDLFCDFIPEKVAALTDSELEEILKDPRIIRNRLKVYATRRNALSFLAIQKEFGSFDRYVWGFVGGRPEQNRWHTHSQIPAFSKESETLSRDLEKRGMTFVGKTIIYAYMQATGLVNDHLVSCPCHAECLKLTSYA